eukprot:3200490-Rhodomonas_salina.1
MERLWEFCFHHCDHHHHHLHFHHHEHRKKKRKPAPCRHRSTAAAALAAAAAAAQTRVDKSTKRICAYHLGYVLHIADQRLRLEVCWGLLNPATAITQLAVTILAWKRARGERGKLRKGSWGSART